jgi:hypothetical protein
MQSGRLIKIAHVILLLLLNFMVLEGSDSGGSRYRNRRPPSIDLSSIHNRLNSSSADSFSLPLNDIRTPASGYSPLSFRDSGIRTPSGILTPSSIHSSDCSVSDINPIHTPPSILSLDSSASGANTHIQTPSAIRPLSSFSSSASSSSSSASSSSSSSHSSIAPDPQPDPCPHPCPHPPHPQPVIEAITSSYKPSGMLAAAVSESQSESADFTSRFAQNHSPNVAAERNDLLSLVQKITEEGPADLGNDQARVWLESFYASGKTRQINNIPSSTDNNRGAMIGVQNASEKDGWVIGTFTGASLLNMHMDNQHQNNIKQNYLFTSLYHSWTFKNGFRYDISGQHVNRKDRIQRLTELGQLAKGKRNSKAQVYNLETSYRIKFQDHLSVRPNLGCNITNQVSGAYDETDVSEFR